MAPPGRSPENPGIFVFVNITQSTQIDYVDLMKQVFRLAELGRGHTGVNPLVGAVVLDERGEFAGSGYHARLGEAHAEIAALEAAGLRARGGTLVVNLEPCCHTGRTGPCTQAIIEAGITRVKIAQRDPDRRVSGRGVEELRRAGVEVEEGISLATALRLNEHYLTFKKTGRPFVTLKMALSLDGFVADLDARSQWLTGPACRAHAHALRSRHDAILVGAGTARADNPRLTVRDAPGPSPRRFVLVGRTPLAESLHLCGGTSPATRIGTRESQADWIVDAGTDGYPDLDLALLRMADAGISSVLVEGGAAVAGGFMQRQLVDKVVFYYGRKLLGAGIPALRGWNRTLEAAPELQDVVLEALADGFVVTGYLKKGSHVHRTD